MYANQKETESDSMFKLDIMQDTDDKSDSEGGDDKFADSDEQESKDTDTDGNGNSDSDSDSDDEKELDEDGGKSSEGVDLEDKSKKEIRLGYVQSYNDSQKSFLIEFKIEKKQIVIPKEEIIEIQTGEYLGEDDIIRYDDVYSRK